MILEVRILRLTWKAFNKIIKMHMSIMMGYTVNLLSRFHLINYKISISIIKYQLIFKYNHYLISDS